MAVKGKEELKKLGEKKLSDHLARLIDAVDERTSDPEHFLSISELEHLWSDAAGAVSKTFSDILSEAVRNIDEKEIIQSKKERSEERGSCLIPINQVNAESLPQTGI